MNKRTLKKQIRYACGEVAMECIITKYCVEGTNAEELNNLVIKAAELQENSLRNTTFAFDKTPRDFDSMHAYHKAKKAYFRKAYKAFYKEFNKQLQLIVDDLNKAIPAEYRKANKPE